MDFLYFGCEGLIEDDGVVVGVAWGHFLGSFFRKYLGEVPVFFWEGDISLFSFLCNLAGYQSFGDGYGNKFSFY